MQITNINKEAIDLYLKEKVTNLPPFVATLIRNFS